MNHFLENVNAETNRASIFHRKNSKRYLWTYTSTLWTIQIFYGVNRCINKFVYFLLGILHLLECLLKLLGCRHNFLIIQYRKFAQIMQVNLHFKHSMTIAYQLELMLNTLLHIYSKWFVESLIKRLQMIVCPLLMKTKLPVSLVRIIAIAYH